MQRAFKKHQWLFKLIISFTILLIMAIYLLFTERLVLLLSFKFGLLVNSFTAVADWLVGGSLFAMLVWSLFSNFLSSRLYSVFWPNKESSTENLESGQTEIIGKLGSLNTKLSEQFAGLSEKLAKVDPRDIEKYLKDLPLKSGKQATEQEIEERYQTKK